MKDPQEVLLTCRAIVGSGDWDAISYLAHTGTPVLLARVDELEAALQRVLDITSEASTATVARRALSGGAP